MSAASLNESHGIALVEDNLGIDSLQRGHPCRRALGAVPAGPIAYEDTGGEGPTIVLCHGVPMDHRAWRNVMPLLAPRFRVISPTLPSAGTATRSVRTPT